MQWCIRISFILAGKHKKLQFEVLWALELPPKQQVRSSNMKEEKMQEKQTCKNAFQRLLGTQQGGRLTFSQSYRYQGTTKTHSKQWHYIQCIPLFPSFLFVHSIFLLFYFSGAIFKSLSGLLGLLGDSLCITTYSHAYRRSSDWPI